MFINIKDYFDEMINHKNIIKILSACKSDP